MNRPRARPRRDQAMPRRENMWVAALRLLKAPGTEGFTMRALAERLGVNPMTVHHHFGGRDALIQALADHVHAGVAPPWSGGGFVRIKALSELLRRVYCTTVIVLFQRQRGGQFRSATGKAEDPCVREIRRLQPALPSIPARHRANCSVQ